SRADPTTYRLPAVERGEDGDTGLYVENFTAMEVFNGYGREKFWTCMNYWFAMVANGFLPAATASSDSHKMYRDPGGSPVSWVHVGAGGDTVMTFDPQQLAVATNEGRLFGSAGPFIRFYATNADGDRVDVGG